MSGVSISTCMNSQMLRAFSKCFTPYHIFSQIWARAVSSTSACLPIHTKSTPLLNRLPFKSPVVLTAYKLKPCSDLKHYVGGWDFSGFFFLFFQHALKPSLVFLQSTLSALCTSSFFSLSEKMLSSVSY